MCWRLEYREKNRKVEKRYKDIHSFWTCVCSEEGRDTSFGPVNFATESQNNPRMIEDIGTKRIRQLLNGD